MSLRFCCAVALIAALALSGCATFHEGAVKRACAATGDNYVKLRIDGTLLWNDVELRNKSDIDNCLITALGVTPIARIHFSLDAGTSLKTVATFLDEVRHKGADKLGFSSSE